jgi:AsmA protein
LSGNGELRSGRTPFDKLNIAMRISQGTATVEDIRLEGTNVRLALAGSASIPTRELDLTGTASLFAAAKETASFDLPFVVQGSWDEPIMLPDAQILIRRSGATAPLLEAVTDKRARDAVRSAIERLTGPSPAAARRSGNSALATEPEAAAQPPGAQ